MKLRFLLIATLLCGCATTKPATQPEAPAQPAQTAPVVEQPKVEEPQQPARSPELEALILAQSSGDREQIENAARTIINTNPAGDDAKHAFVALAQNTLTTSPDTARLYIERAAEISPNDYDVQYELGRIAHAQHQDDEALSHFATAAQANPKTAAPCIDAAKILIQYLDIERAFNQATCAYEREPSRCEAISIYADALYASKKFDEAAQTYEKYIAASCSESIDILKNLAKLNETKLDNTKRACELYTRLTQLVPDDPNYKASRDFQCQPKE